MGAVGRVSSPLPKGATVLQRLARLYEIVIQGATKGATKCNGRCYISKPPEARLMPQSDCSTENSEEPVEVERKGESQGQERGLFAMVLFGSVWSGVNSAIERRPDKSVQHRPGCL
jgi:hypothetical protein